MVRVGRKITLLKIVAIVLVFTASFFAGKLVTDWRASGDPQQVGSPKPVDQSSDEEEMLPVDRLNVLLMGTDTREGEKDARTDSLVLVSIDRETKKIAMISVPRDTMVEIKGYGTNKINSANVFGGPDLARKTVEELLSVEIPYYVKTNFDGFKDIIDILGGVDIDVEKRMYYPAEDIDLKSGQQRLGGYDALAYVRYRNDALGDISRAKRQQNFLKALAKEMLRPGAIIKAPKLIPKLMDAVETNLGLGDAILVAKAASRLDSNNIATATLPGVFYNYKGMSYWKVDQDEAELVLKDLFAGVKVATITGPDITIPAEDESVEDTEENQEVDSGEQFSVYPGTDTEEQNSEEQNTDEQNTEEQNTDEQTGDGGVVEGQNPDQQSGESPGQGQTGQYPGQDQASQYPGQDQAEQTPGQPPGQNQNDQIIIDEQNSGDMDNLNIPPAGEPVQGPDGSTNVGQIGTEAGANTSSGVVYGG